MAFRHILVVDDEHSSADMLKEILEMDSSRRTVDVAYDGQDAVDRALNQRPDFIIMDLEMPVLSGEEAAARILRHYGTNPPCLIALSGNSFRLRNLEGGNTFAHLLIKPLNVDELLDIVQ